MDETPLVLNPHAQVSRIPLFGNEHCLVLDDVLADPDAARDWAIARREHFGNNPRDYFPGPQFSLPDPVYAPLVHAFRRHWRRDLSMARPVSEHDARFSLVSAAPGDLRPEQRMCHRDAPPPTPEAVAAGVLYLFRDPRLGGTLFFEPVYDEERDGPEADYLRRRDLDFEQRRGYMTEGNAWFRKVAEVPARYNRLILYPGHVYHTGNISRPDLLSPDPEQGRLTLNLFIKGIRV